jgi:hypothetical protein
LMLIGPRDGVCVCRDRDTDEYFVVEFVSWRECFAEIERELRSSGRDWECSHRRPSWEW